MLDTLTAPMKRILLSLCLLCLFGFQACKEKEEVPSAKKIEEYRKGAAQGEARAQYNLGFCYYNGEGVPEGVLEAMKWYRKAADQEYAPAQLKLGDCFLYGKGLAKDDPEEAVKWYRKAAEQGYAEAQYNIGFCYYWGKGMIKDTVESSKWFRKAAEQGNSFAQHYLGLYYITEKDEHKDIVEAYKWFKIASASGDKVDEGMVRESARHMTPFQIEEAERRARAWKPKTEAAGH